MMKDLLKLHRVAKQTWPGFNVSAEIKACKQEESDIYRKVKGDSSTQTAQLKQLALNYHQVPCSRTGVPDNPVKKLRIPDPYGL